MSFLLGENDTQMCFEVFSELCETWFCFWNNLCAYDCYVNIMWYDFACMHRGAWQGAYDLEVATPRALVHAGVKTSGNARSRYKTSGDARSRLMLVGKDLMLSMQVNAVRHKLMLMEVNAVRPALTTTSAQVKKVNGVTELQALVDGKPIIVSEASIRRILKLNDEGGMDCLPNATIFEEITRMGYEMQSQKLTFYKAFFSPQWKFMIHTFLQCLSAKTTAWNKFSSIAASAIICLSTNH
ncbi:hypothetical protein Tco_0194828 [Tanacetum coccineum]